MYRSKQSSTTYWDARREEEKGCSWRDLNQNNNVMRNFFQSAEKAATSQAEEATDAEDGHVRANFTSQEVDIVSAGAISTTCEVVKGPYINININYYNINIIVGV